MNQPLRVGIIGDLNPDRPSHAATNQALQHAACALSTSLDLAWLPTGSLEDDPGGMNLGHFDALWCAPGSPYKSMDGALRAIRFARERGYPFIGT